MEFIISKNLNFIIVPSWLTLRMLLYSHSVFIWSCQRAEASSKASHTLLSVSPQLGQSYQMLESRTKMPIIPQKRNTISLTLLQVDILFAIGGSCKRFSGQMNWLQTLEEWLENVKGRLNHWLPAPPYAVLLFKNSILHFTNRPPEFEKFICVIENSEKV